MTSRHKSLLPAGPPTESAFPLLEHWWQKVVWTTQEAALLLAGSDPNGCNYSVKDNVLYVDLREGARLLTGEYVATDIFVELPPYRNETKGDEKLFRQRALQIEGEVALGRNFRELIDPEAPPFPWRSQVEADAYIQRADTHERILLLVRKSTDLAKTLYSGLHKAFPSGLTTPKRALQFAIEVGISPAWNECTAVEGACLPHNSPHRNKDTGHTKSEDPLDRRHRILRMVEYEQKAHGNHAYERVAEMEDRSKSLIKGLCARARKERKEWKKILPLSETASLLGIGQPSPLESKKPHKNNK